MMNSNDNLQTRLDRIGQWKAFDIDWAHLRNLAALGLVDLCALSVGVDPEYARLVRGMTTIDPDNIPKPEEIAELAGYRNEAIEKWERRVGEALSHVAAGTLPIARTAAPLGGHDPYEAIPDDAEKIVVKVADFVAWATALPVPWELPEEMKRMGPYPEAEEGLQVGGGGAKALGKRERDTLLTIIAAFCKFESIDPKERGLAAKIAQWTQDLGAPVTDDTIRAVLAQIPDAVDSRMK
jgi:hypothetical protein